MSVSTTVAVNACFCFGKGGSPPLALKGSLRDLASLKY